MKPNTPLTRQQVEELKAAIARTWNQTVTEAIAKAIRIPYASDRGRND